MQHNTKLTRQFYQAVGKLYFAIASSDKNVELIEIETLKDIVKSHWLVTESTANDDAHEIINEFLNLHENNRVTANDCFLEFNTFKNQHASMFTDSMNQLILKTANAIASSFSSRNKSELIMLAKLDMALKNNS